VYLPCLALGVMLALAGSARAFSIKSGFTDGCHERVTADGYLAAKTPWPMRPQVPVPDGEWEEITDYLLKGAAYQPRTRREKYLMFSLLTGVRSPDIEGFSSSSLSALRAIQAHPEGQYDHCLRAIEDDYLEGNAATLTGCREAIQAQLNEAHDILQQPPQEQNIRVNFSLDFYGTFKVDVWGVAYHVGRAIHPFEDSFTHTLRTPDMRSVIHFLNYVEAIAGDLKEDRDGMAHSTEVDECFNPKNQDRTQAATQAVTELLEAAASVLNDDEEGPENVRAVLERWLTYTEGQELGYDEGCIQANDYCDSQWLALARVHPSKPYLSCSLSASATGTPVRGSLAILGLLSCLATLIVRRRH
jgi:hypothetical protein